MKRPGQCFFIGFAGIALAAIIVALFLTNTKIKTPVIPANLSNSKVLVQIEGTLDAEFATGNRMIVFRAPGWSPQQEIWYKDVEINPIRVGQKVLILVIEKNE